MNLIGLCNLYWWSINDNPDNPLLISKEMIVQFLNDAVKELSQVVDYKKYAEIIPEDSTGIIPLPTDVIKIEKARWSDKDLSPISDIHTALLYKPDRKVSQYYHLNLATVQVFPAPKEDDTGPLKIWYKAYLPALINDNDAPVDIPEEYHKDLALVFVRAQHAFKMGRYSEYQFLANLWEDIKKELGGEYTSRVVTVIDENQGRFNW